VPYVIGRTIFSSEKFKLTVLVVFESSRILTDAFERVNYIMINWEGEMFVG